jgi:hypothetical protein
VQHDACCPAGPCYAMLFQQSKFCLHALGWQGMLLAGSCLACCPCTFSTCFALH